MFAAAAAPIAAGDRVVRIVVEIAAAAAAAVVGCRCCYRCCCYRQRNGWYSVMVGTLNWYEVERIPHQPPASSLFDDAVGDDANAMGHVAVAAAAAAADSW